MEPHKNNYSIILLRAPANFCGSAESTSSMKSAQISIERSGPSNGGVWEDKANKRDPHRYGAHRALHLRKQGERATSSPSRRLLSDSCVPGTVGTEGEPLLLGSRHCLVLEDSHEGVQGQHATLGPYCGSDGVKGVCLLLHYS